MKNMIESLESRTLFAGTSAATLAADSSLITSDAAALKGAVSSLLAVDLSNNKTIATDLRGSHAPVGTNAILRSINTDQAKLKAVLTRDANSLINSSLPLVKRSVTAGNSLLAKSNKPKISRVALDASALGKVTIKPLAKLSADLASTKLFTDLEALRTLNSTNVTVVAAITAREQGDATQKAAVTAAATKFKTDIDALSTDLVNIFTP